MDGGKRGLRVEVVEGNGDRWKGKWWKEEVKVERRKWEGKVKWRWRTVKIEKKVFESGADNNWKRKEGHENNKNN